MYLFGFACAWFIAMHRAKAAHSVINRQQVESLITYGAFGVILGGRAGYVLFYHFNYWLTDPLWLFRIWEGGDRKSVVEGKPGERSGGNGGDGERIFARVLE